MNIELFFTGLVLAFASLFGFFWKRTQSEEANTASLSSKNSDLHFVCPNGDYWTPAPKYMPRTPLTCPRCGRRLIAR